MAGPIHQHLEKRRTLKYSETWTTLKRYDVHIHVHVKDIKDHDERLKRYDV